ncbi:MAG: hypothetical protein ACTSQM_03950 [Candidatus Odinarchaeia archaeon]
MKKGSSATLLFALMLSYCILAGSVLYFIIPARATYNISWWKTIHLSAINTYSCSSAGNNIIIVDLHGDIHIVTYEKTSCQLEDYNIYYWTNSSGQWVCTKISQSLSTPQVNPVIALDSNNVIHIVWCGKVGDNYDLFYVNNSEGTWSLPYNITRTPDVSEEYPSITVDSSGAIHLVFINMKYNTVMYMNKSSVGWSTPINITDPATFSEIRPPLSIAVDSNNHVYVGFSARVNGSENTDVFLCNNSLGTWSMPLNVSKDPEKFDLFPSIGIDSQDNIHVVWASNVANYPWTGVLKYANNSGNVWHEPIVINGTGLFVTSTSISIDSNDNVHIAFSQWNKHWAGEIFYVNNTSGNFETPINVSRTPTVDDDNPHILVDKNNVVHILYDSAEYGAVYAETIKVQLTPVTTYLLTGLILTITLSITSIYVLFKSKREGR